MAEPGYDVGRCGGGTHVGVMRIGNELIITGAFLGVRRLACVIILELHIVWHRMHDNIGS
jgi:hypothetical protein